MKKILVALALIILVTGGVGADLVATIGMTGLSFVNPAAATIVRTALCVTSPVGIVTCAVQFVGGKVIGQLQGEVIQQIAEVSPEAAQAIITYNQIKGYIDSGTNIMEELEINEKGEVKSGILNPGKDKIGIGNLINKDLKEDDISTNANVKFFPGGAELTFYEGKDNVYAKKIKDPNTGEEIELTYENIKEGEFIIDHEGNLLKFDFITNEEGGIYLFGSHQVSVPPNSHVKFDGLVPGRNFITVEMPKGSTLDSFPIRRNFLGDDKEIIFIGENINLPENNRLLEGKLSYKNGQLFIRSFAIINDIDIQSRTLHIINLYLDEEIIDLESDYIHFDSDQKKLTMQAKNEDASFHVGFGSGNVFLQTEAKYLSSFPSVEMNNMLVTVQNREDQDLTTKVNIKLIPRNDGKDNKLELKNGGFYFKGSFAERFKSISMPIGNDFSGTVPSSPMSIFIEDHEGNSILGTSSDPHKIIIRESNEFVMVPVGATEETLSYGFTERKISERLSFSQKENYQQSITDFNKAFEKEGIEIKLYDLLTERTTSDSNYELGKLKIIHDGLIQLTPELRESVSSVIIYTEEEWREVNIQLFDDPNRASAFTNRDGMIRFDGQLSEKLVSHEAAHDYTYELNRKSDDKSDLISKYIKSLNRQKKIGGELKTEKASIESLRESFTGEDFDKVYQQRLEAIKYFEGLLVSEKSLTSNLENIIKKPSNKIFLDEWLDVSDDHGRSFFKKGVGAVWSDNGVGPRFGFVTTYAGINYFEDIAEYVEETKFNQMLIKKLINQDSGFYQDLINNDKITEKESLEWADIYLKKLKLLKKWGFITEEDYNKVIK